MKLAIVVFVLVGAVFPNPILFKVALEPSGLEANMTLSSSASQSYEQDTSELQSSEENTLNQSSESESSESTSEDKTSEESDSQSREDPTSKGETRDNSMASDENVRKGWIHSFGNVILDLSDEDNSSTEATGEPDHGTHKQPTTGTVDTDDHLPSQISPGDSQSTETGQDITATSDSSDTSDVTTSTAATQSSESTSSESSDTSEASDSRDTSESTESEGSDSADVEQRKAKKCQRGDDSTGCESEEYFFQQIGDDAYYPSDHLMMPDDDHMELNLRR